MLFVAFIETDMARIKELAEAAMKRGDVEGLKTVGSYGTPVGKGVHIFDADSEEAVFKYYTPEIPFLKKLEVYPALPLEKVIPFHFLALQS